MTTRRQVRDVYWEGIFLSRKTELNYRGNNLCDNTLDFCVIYPHADIIECRRVVVAYEGVNMLQIICLSLALPRQIPWKLNPKGLP